MAGKFEIKKSSNGEFFFSLKRASGDVILISEQYKAKSGAEGGIELVKANAPVHSLYERKKSSAGQYYFVLKAVNGQPLGRSEMYSSTAEMERGIEAVKTNAPNGRVEELTW